MCSDVLRPIEKDKSRGLRVAQHTRVGRGGGEGVKYERDKAGEGGIVIWGQRTRYKGEQVSDWRCSAQHF